MATVTGTNSSETINQLDGVTEQGDRIRGLGGNDTLTGGQGADIFVFNTALDNTGNVDVLSDFSVADDSIRLDDTFFAALAPGALAASAFKSLDAGPTDADDRILYNPVTGNLAYDADGSGSAFAAIKFANVATHAAPTSADFVVI